MQLAWELATPAPLLAKPGPLCCFTAGSPGTAYGPLIGATLSIPWWWRMSTDCCAGPGNEAGSRARKTKTQEVSLDPTWSPLLLSKSMCTHAEWELVQPLWKSAGQSLPKVNVCSIFDPAILLLGLCPVKGRACVHQKKHTEMPEHYLS